ncbi:MAG: molecular chaperone DnaJ [Ectothiorhodospiraceae bacterium]|nr:molecular chaperone DnaJ [Ectothiorhodospiraceae bacterium]
MIQVVVALALLGLIVYLLGGHRLPWVKRQGRSLLLWAALGFVLLLLVFGRIHWLAGLAMGALLMARRLMPFLGLLPMARRLFGAPGGGGSGAGPTMNAAMVSVWMDQDTGTMDGDVLRGPWRGWRLSRLSMDQVLELLDDCRQKDGQSAALVQAYLDRTYGARWRRDQDMGRQQAMTREEACAILGVSPDADRDTVVAAHRRLIQKLHPDRGGSDYLASRVNEAKRRLLR